MPEVKVNIDIKKYQILNKESNKKKPVEYPSIEYINPEYITEGIIDEFLMEQNDYIDLFLN